MSEYIYGMHDRTGECIKHFGDRLSWLVSTEAIGHDPNDHGGRDYSEWADQGIDVIARLNNGYYPIGTIPEPAHYEDFAARCANFVENSQGCHIWIVGNEPNMVIERPDDQPILPSDYALCYTLCQEAIQDLAGHEDDQVCVAAIAPWNNQTAYPSNEVGDWIVYFQDVLGNVRILAHKVDAIALHCYSHGPEPSLITSEAKMNPPFEHRRFQFRTYRDFLDAVSRDLRHLPVYITEANQNDAWDNSNSGWVQAAYKEIDEWNHTPGMQKIRGCVLYRWPKHDKYFIEDKIGVYADFEAAMAHGYKWMNDGDNGGNGMETVELPLINGDLEGGFRQVDGIGELTVAEGWFPWWHPGSARPEYKAATLDIDPRRVHSGNAAQQWFNNFAKHTAGICQRLENVPVGAELTFEAWVQAFVSDKDDFSQSDGRYRMRIGIDVYGGTDPEGEDVVWSDDGHSIQPYDEYQYLSVEAVARSDRCTVFIQGQNEWPLKHNNGYVDDCKLLARIEEPEPDPPPTGEGFSEEDIRGFAIDEIRKAFLRAAG